LQRETRLHGRVNTNEIRELLAGGEIVREPAGNENGYWAGAPGAFYAADERAWFLTYRIRRPRGIAPDRGGEARIARSSDGQHWEDVWSVTKDRYNSASIERSAVRKGADGLWRYFTSYVDPADARWCVSVIKASSIDELDPSRVQPVFKAQPLGLEGVKDPWLFEHGGRFHMILSVAVPTPRTGADSHATLDIFNTGECVSATALASSDDLENWTWHGVILAPPASGWDRYCRRINSIVPSGGRFFAFYDGSASHLENYEEKTALAVSSDLKKWQTLTADGPLFTSPHASGSLRYIDAQIVGNDAFVFYEFARADSAHDLRLLRLSAESLCGTLQTCA
jgi:hypothetical protein